MTFNIKLERGVKRRVAKMKRVSPELVGKVINGDREDLHGIIPAIIKENKRMLDLKKKREKQKKQFLKSKLPI